MHYHGPPRRGAPLVPAGAGGMCVVLRLSPPVIRIGLHRPRGSGGVPAGCTYVWQEVAVVEACTAAVLVDVT